MTIINSSISAGVNTAVGSSNQDVGSTIKKASLRSPRVAAQRKYHQQHVDLLPSHILDKSKDILKWLFKVKNIYVCGFRTKDDIFSPTVKASTNIKVLVHIPIPKEAAFEVSLG